MPRVFIDLECGSTTCASEPGKFCKFLGTRRFGMSYVCRLFPSADEAYTNLQDDKPGGWIQRCAACLQATNTVLFAVLDDHGDVRESCMAANKDEAKTILKWDAEPRPKGWTLQQMSQ